MVVRASRAGLGGMVLEWERGEVIMGSLRWERDLVTSVWSIELERGVVAVARSLGWERGGVALVATMVGG